MAGRPISRATIAECDSRLPRSTSRPAAAGNSMTQPGSVRSATRISPRLTGACCGSRTSRTRPRTTPGQQPSRLPRVALGSAPPAVAGADALPRCRRCRASRSGRGRRRQRRYAANSALRTATRPLRSAVVARCLDERQHLVDFEEEHVARRLQADRSAASAPPEFDEDPRARAEDAACARSAGSRGPRRARGRAAAPRRTPARRSGRPRSAPRDARFGTTRAESAGAGPRRVSGGVGVRDARQLPDARSSGSGSSCSVRLSSFSSSRQRSPNASR